MKQSFQSYTNSHCAQALNNRTRSSSSSVATGAAASLSKNQTQSMAKNRVPLSDDARLGSFNTPGQPAPADPFMSFIAPNRLQQNHLTHQALQAAAAQRSGQNLTANAATLAANALKQQGTRAQNANAAALAGAFSREASRKLTQEQINQFVAMGIPVAALAGAGVSAALPPNPNPASLTQAQATQALTTQMLQQMRVQHNASLQGSNVGGNSSHGARAPRAPTGMTVSQSRNANAEGIRGAQERYASFDRNQVQAAAANQRLDQRGAAGSEEFWVKLEEMKRKYREPLRRMYGFAQIVTSTKRPDEKERFKKNLDYCFQIFELSRGKQVPSSLTMRSLEKVCKFLDHVINVYENILAREQQNANSNTGRQVAASSSQASRYALMQGGVAAVPQNTALHNAQSHQDLIMKLHQQQQFNQQQSAAAAAAMGRVGGHVSGTKKNVENAPAGRVPNRGQPKHGGGHAQLGLNAAQIGMSMKPEQTDVLPSHGIFIGDVTNNQKLLLQRRAALSQPRNQQSGQQQLPPGFGQQQHAVAAAAAGLHRGAAAQQRGAQAAPAAVGMNTMKGNNMPLQEIMKHNAGSGELGGVGTANGGVQDFVGALPIKTEAANAVTATANASAGTKAAAPMSLKNTEAYLEQRLNKMSAIVKAAHVNSLRLEQAVESEMERRKAERIQNTLVALRNLSNTSALVSGVGDKKRSSSQLDLENCSEGDGMIQSKSVFESSSEQGLRLAKRPKNNIADLKSARESVEADCKAAQERNPVLSLEIYEEFGQPVVECMLLIEEIKLPKLVLRVQLGYPRKGGVTYGFERPPLGWVGVLATIRARFKRCLAYAPAASVGVAALLDVWAREAESVVEAELRSWCSDVSDSDEELNCQVKQKVAEVMQTAGA